MKKSRSNLTGFMFGGDELSGGGWGTRILPGAGFNTLCENETGRAVKRKKKKWHCEICMIDTVAEMMRRARLKIIFYILNFLILWSIKNGSNGSCSFICILKSGHVRIRDTEVLNGMDSAREKLTDGALCQCLYLIKLQQ